MLRRSFHALALGLGLVFLLPTPAFASSGWGEIAFQVSSGSTIVRVVGHRSADAPMNAFRFLAKSSDQPWSASAPSGAGISAAAFSALRTAAAASQALFDAEATTALGDWYPALAPEVQSQLRDVARRTAGTGFVVKLESAGNSDPATLGDLGALQDALLVNDRPAFDDAAGIAWGAWYTGLSPADADIIVAVIIDATGAG
jgi:hypothetical protein